MTFRETEMVVEETAEVQVCDECGIGNDENELVTYTPQSGRVSEGYEPLHYHPSCLEDLDARTSADGIDVREVASEATSLNIWLAMDGLDTLLAGVGVGVGLLAAWGYGAYNDPLLAVFGGVVMALGVLAGCGFGIAQAGETNNELQRRA